MFCPAARRDPRWALQAAATPSCCGLFRAVRGIRTSLRAAAMHLFGCSPPLLLLPVRELSPQLPARSFFLRAAALARPWGCTWTEDQDSVYCCMLSTAQLLSMIVAACPTYSTFERVGLVGSSTAPPEAAVRCHEIPQDFFDLPDPPLPSCSRLHASTQLCWLCSPRPHSARPSPIRPPTRQASICKLPDCQT